VFRRVVATGAYLPDAQVFIDNRLNESGRAGFHVVTPLRIEGAGHAVLVNRGWIARDAAYPKAPAAPAPAGVVTVHGLAAVPPARVLELSANVVAGEVWQNLSIAKYRELKRIDVLPFVVLANPPSPGLAAVEEKPDAGVARHQEYALTWFSLAATVVVLWLVVNLRRD
jgi:surfeit locus 1 family protein